MTDITLEEVVALLVEAEGALRHACYRFQGVERARQGKGHIPAVAAAHELAEKVLCKIATLKRSRPMDEAEFRANPPRPGDKVWLRPQTVTSVDVRDSVVRIVGAYFNAADIDRIERAPRVPVAGDRDLVPGGATGELLFIYGAWAMIDVIGGLPSVYRLSDLKVIEP